MLDEPTVGQVIRQQDRIIDNQSKRSLRRIIATAIAQIAAAKKQPIAPAMSPKINIPIAGNVQ